MSDFYVEFEVASEDRYRRLDAVVSALAAAKRDDDFRDDAYWLAFFDDEARSRFWWPTEAELQEWSRCWQAAPVDVRTSDPSFLPPAWDFGSMIDAFRNGDYELLGCRRASPRVGRLAFEPFGFPYGGTGCMRALIEAFGHRVTADAAA
ncbi:MAG: hypothetical protein WED34_13810 [Planctomycetales bacterium]